MIEFSTFVVLGINFFLWYNTLIIMGFSDDDIRDKIKYNIARVLWYFLHKFSIIQLKSQKYIINPIYTYLYKPIQYILSSKYYDIYRIILVKDGREIIKLKRKDDLINTGYEYDFIMYHTDAYNVLMLENINDLPDLVQIDRNILKTNVSFLCCQMTAMFESTKIIKLFELSDFLLNNNKILTRDFVKWYCKKHFHNEEWVQLYDFDNYTINLMDNEVNEVNIDSTQFIVLRENTYNVYNNEKYHTNEYEISNNLENMKDDNDNEKEHEEIVNEQKDIGALNQDELKERWGNVMDLFKTDEKPTTKDENEITEVKHTELQKYTNDSSSSLELEECSDGDKNLIKIYC